MRSDVRAGRPRRWWTLWCALLLLAASAAIPAYGAAPAYREAPAYEAAPRGTSGAPRPGTRAVAAQNPLSVTYVARACPRYTDIMANKARNNIQESLRDLGPDSNYSSSEAVSAAKEAAGTPLPPCEPLTGWTFSTGRGITGPNGGTQNLSTLTGPLRQDITTTASTPELDAAGDPTGRTLQGAVTVPLTDAETAALNAHALWTQGGTPAQALNGKQEQYGFGALRCAQDAFNGDNVEHLTLPAGTRHIFCYYYAVTPPPGAGTIKIVKHVDGPGQGDFRYEGNLSYADANHDGVNDFTLSASSGADASQTFVRGASDIDTNPWTLKESLPSGSGWQLEGAPSCDVRTGSGDPGRSEVSTDSGGALRIGLVAGETVTCRYSNRRTAGAGLLSKESLGATGTFDIDLETPPGAPPVGTTPVTTSREGVPVTVADADSVVTGTYTVTEHKPAPDGRGTWELTRAVCGGEEEPVTDAGDTWRVSHEVTAGENPHCRLTDTFTPGGAIGVEKVTRGGTGTFGYAVTAHPAAGGPSDGEQYTGTATTEAENTVTPAVREDGSPGPVASGLTVDDSVRYTVQEFLPPASEAGRWVLDAVDCGGAQEGPPRPGGSSVEVRLTPAHPKPTCRFANRFVPAGTLDVIKTTSDDEKLRPDAARLALSCADGVDDGVDIAPGATGGSIPEHAFNEATTCTVTEPRTGAAADAKVTTSASVAVGGGTQRPLGLGDSFAVRPGERTVFRVANVFTGTSPSPSPSPSPHPSPSVPVSPAPGHGAGTFPPGGGPGGARLPHTGEDRYWLAPAAGIAFALLIGGGVLLRMAWLRRRRYE
ncbi:prealbumin-like fold domain-containing protein [Streptomyces sp. CA-253872]|uniref:prealbumin-like fold domain-containing protein n=1 Tax=Streptomyces sp. CA-253872 TaxID=3240067 RepID=UPI003D8FC083